MCLGNWNYAAGIGNDPRENRKFNMIKQELNHVSFFKWKIFLLSTRLLKFGYYLPVMHNKVNPRLQSYEGGGACGHEPSNILFEPCPNPAKSFSSPANTSDGMFAVMNLAIKILHINVYCNLLFIIQTVHHSSKMCGKYITMN